MIVNTSLPYNSKRLEGDISQLIDTYPVLESKTIGYSVQNKPITELTLGAGSRKVHFNGAFHANEWITSLVLMKWLEDFLFACKNFTKIGLFDAQEIFKEVKLSIVPMVNPDGVDLVVDGPSGEWGAHCLSINDGKNDFSQWKANIRGVDLNNQFPAFWEIEKERKIPKHPAAFDFPGNRPLSEPEAMFMVKLAIEKEFDRTLAFHTQGREFYWGYCDLHPKESSYIAKIFEDLSGYKAIEHIDSHAGFRDWFIKEFRRPGFTIELGEGVNPLPIEQFSEIYDDVINLICASLLY